jgi:hypothetical protein
MFALSGVPGGFHGRQSAGLSCASFEANVRIAWNRQIYTVLV